MEVSFAPVVIPENVPEPHVLDIRGVSAWMYVHQPLMEGFLAPHAFFAPLPLRCLFWTGIRFVHSKRFLHVVEFTD